MKKLSLSLLVSSCLLSGHTMAASSITEAFEESSPVLDLRLRYESNDTSGNTTPKGEALTLRSIIGIKTGEYEGFSFYADMTDVSALDDDYSPNGQSTEVTDPIADPEGAELNQAYVQYKTDGHQVRLGRQRIIYDNARFIGNVGWRQNEQTYDALSYQNTSIENVKLNLAYVSYTYGIQFKEADTSAILANLQISDLGPGKLTPYIYVIETENENERTTYGASYAGKTGGDMPFIFKAEVASQTFDVNGGDEFDTEYLNVEIGTALSGVTLKLGYELQGSDEGASSFKTPLGTNHKFNGWADRFLNTPDAGLEDAYLSVSGKVSGIKLVGIYHTFSTDEGGNDLGTEFDLLAVKQFSKNYSAGLKFAAFSEEEGSGLGDTDKVWVWTQAKF